MKNPRLRSIVIEAGLAMIVFTTDPFGLSEQKLRSFDNAAAILTQYLRPSSTSKIAVVLIDEPTLLEWRLDWPISYAKTADLIRILACAHVGGIFFDWGVGRRFDLAEGQDALKRAVSDSSADAGTCADQTGPTKVPVFFGRIDGVESPMDSWLAQRGSSFLLDAGESDGVYQVGSQKFPARAVPQSDVSPAFGLIRVPPLLANATPPGDGLPCQHDDGRPVCWRNPLALIWTTPLDRQQAQVSRTLNCRGMISWAWTLLGVTPFDGDERFEACPPVLTLRGVDLARDLNFIERSGDPAAALSGRFVLVGADLPGLNDQVATPLHDHLPGVYKHAVALGELMEYGSRYPTLPEPKTLIAIAGAIYLLLEFSREYLHGSRIERAALLVIFASCVLGLSTVVFWRRWPVSLVFAVFIDYIGVVFALHAAREIGPKVARHRKARAAGSGGQTARRVPP